MVAGPHRSFTSDWEKMGQVAYSYEVLPEVTQHRRIHQVGLDVPLLGWGDHFDSDHVSPPSASSACMNILAARRAPRNSHIFDKLEKAGTEITYRCKDCRECPECKKSDRFESISIQEEVEQAVIENTINVDIKRVGP